MPGGYVDLGAGTSNYSRLGNSMTYLIAASNAAPSSKQKADYQCAGIGDQIQINTAIQALPAGGGKIELSDGTFYLSDTIWIERNNVTIQGAGASPPSTQIAPGATTGGSRLQATEGMSAEALYCETDGTEGHPPTDVPLYGILLRDFTVDMVGRGTDGIKFVSHRGLIDNVHVHNAAGNGIRIKGYSTWTTYDTMLSCCKVLECAGAGILLDEFSPDLHLTSCVSGRNGYGLHVRSANHIITACHFYGNQQANVFFDDNGRFSKLVGCKIEGSQGYGLMIVASQNWIAGIVISGCGFRDNGRGEHNTYDHVFIGGDVPAIDHIISGCVFESLHENKSRYGVSIGPNGGNTIITSNHFRDGNHYGTGAVYTHEDAKDCIVKHNGGVVDGKSQYTDLIEP